MSEENEGTPFPGCLASVLLVVGVVVGALCGWVVFS